MDIRFLKGKSVSLTIVFNAEYNYANIQDVIVKLKDDTIAKKSNNTLLSTSNPRVFRVELTSEYTNALGSLSKLQVYLDDSSLGVFPFEAINVYADASLGFANTSINEGSDFTINLTVNLLNPNLDIETVEIYNTFSSQALALKSNIASPTFTGKITTPDILVSNLTASQLIATDASDNLVSLATATYPSLTELTYVKGVTSALQTQLGAKANLASPTFTGTVNMATLTTSGAINGITVGFGAGANSTNIVLGNTSFSANTTGIESVCIGLGSLNANISGSYNVSVGSRVLNNLNSGGSNVAIGFSAGRYISNNSTAAYDINTSIFIGQSARPLADSQTNQIVIGNSAVGLGSNTTVLGNSSTSFGRWWGNLLLGSSTNSGEALQVTGTTKLAGNTAVTGTLSVSSTINGISVGFGGGAINTNTAIGLSAGAANTTGGANVYLGALAGIANTNGSRNTFLGRSSAEAMTSGDDNIMIGWSSGKLTVAASSNILCNDSIFIGNGSRAGASGQTNQTVIGHSAIGLGSNTTVLGNSSTVTTGIWGDIRLVKGMGTAPTSATATGTVGDIRITSTAIYVCTATNTWKKSDLTTF